MSDLTIPASSSPAVRLGVKLGDALQHERRKRGLSQGQLAELADLSLKYIGEIERAEANVSLSTLERICVALDWDPFELPLREADTLPEGIRTLLLAELTHMQSLVQTAIGWVQTLDAAMVRRVCEPSPLRDLGPPQLSVRRGRPRRVSNAL